MALAEHQPQVDSMDVDSLQVSITEVVHILMAWRGVRAQQELIPVLGLDQSGVSRTMRGKRKWTAADLLRLATFFDVEPGLFFHDPETLIRNRCSSLEVVPVALGQVALFEAREDDGEQWVNYNHTPELVHA